MKVSDSPRCLLVFLAVPGFLAACATGIPEDALRLEESSVELRSIQSRSFAAPSEIVILSSSISALQDMEYNLDEIDKSLGVLTASKTVDASSPSEVTALVMLDILCAMGGGGGCGASATASDSQSIHLTMVVLPSLERADEFVVRTTLTRVVMDTQKRIKLLQNIEDPQVYQDIFERIDKAIFLEINQT